MIENLLIILKFSTIFFFLTPLVYNLLPKEKDKISLTLISSVGISLGLGSYLLYILYLFHLTSVLLDKAYLLFLFIFVVQVFLSFRALGYFIWNIKKNLKLFNKKYFNLKYFKKIFIEPFGIIKLLIVIILVYVFLLNPFFPLSMWDDLVRYGAWASQIFTRGEIGNHINSYPLLVTMLYVFGFLSSGFRNDYLIKLIPFVFGCLTLVLTYIVANDIFRNRKNRGVIAVFFLLCFVPFIDWWHLGYVDIASSFYYLLTFYFFYLFSKNRNISFLILTGLFLGLSLWCKQQALPLYISLFITILSFKLNVYKEFIDLPKKLLIRDYFLIVFISLLIIGPWYLRDFMIAGTPLQIPVFDSKETFTSLILPFIYNSESVGQYAGALFQISFIFSLYYLFKIDKKGIFVDKNRGLFISIIFIVSPLFAKAFGTHHFISGLISSGGVILFFTGIYLFFYCLDLQKKIFLTLRNEVYFLLLFILPYYLIWWLKYPMVFRYLLTIAPLFCLLFVFFIDQFIDGFEKYVRENILFKFILTIIIVSLVSVRLGDIFNLKDLGYIFSDPDTKQIKLIGEAYPTGIFLGSLFRNGSRLKIISTDNRLAYYAPQINFYNIAPAYLSDLVGFDYLVLNPWTNEAFELRKKDDKEIYFNLLHENPKVFKKIYDQGQYKIYQILVTKEDFTNNNKFGKIEKRGEYLKILPDDKKFHLAFLNDQLTIWGDQMFYNRSEEISSIANKRLLEASENCLNKNKCAEAKEPLLQFKQIILILKSKINDPNRLINDGNYYIMNNLQKSFFQWVSILDNLSKKDSNVSILAKQLLNTEVNSLLEDFDDKVARKEPIFSYYNKDGKYVK